MRFQRLSGRVTDVNDYQPSGRNGTRRTDSDQSRSRRERARCDIIPVCAPLTGSLVYLLEDDNEFARFHAAQSIVFGVASIVVYVTLNIATTVMAMLVGDLLCFLIAVLSFLSQMGLGFALLLVWLYLLVTAFQGKRTSLPVPRSMAEEHLL